MSPPSPTQLKCNYHLADTKIHFLADGHSHRYLAFLKLRLSFLSPSFCSSLPCRPTFSGGAKRKKGRATGENGRAKRKSERLEQEDDDRNREQGESFWEDAIMRSANSGIGRD